MDPNWSYVSMVDRLSKGDITKEEAIFETNYIYCLTKLLFWNDKDTYTNQINKMNQQKNKTR